MKKKIVSWLLTCMMGLSLMACGSKPTEEAAEQPATEKEELTVFAAASMTETLTAISELYKEENPNVDEIIRRYKTDKEDFYNLEFKYTEVENNDEEDLDLASHAIMVSLGLS